MALALYEVNSKYIDFLIPFAPHLFHNKKVHQQNERKYIGVVLEVNGISYFAPLTSFKSKHEKMKNNLEIIKLGTYAVININNMFPVPKGEYKFVKISEIEDAKYKDLLLAEYRLIKKLQDRIKKNAKTLYRYKIKNANSTALAKRCNDFLILEERCKAYGNEGETI